MRGSGFRRLLGVRLTAQFGDGMFQAALGGAVLFNPERQADPIAVAAGLAVMLLPYSLIGPFAGALLDRWDRRRVLLVANLLRAALVALVAVLVGTGVADAPLYLGALAVAGVSRFVLSGLSAALPHVVHPRHLVEANVVAATAGAAAAALGGATAIALRVVIGAGDAGSAVVTAIALTGSICAAGIAAGFRRRLLGPDETDEPSRALLAVALGLADGARATAATPTVAGSFLALAAHRLAFGLNTLLSLLLFRHAFTDEGVLRTGMAGVGEAVLLAALGLGAAALLTPWLVRRCGRARTVRIAVVAAAVTQLGLAATLSLPTVLAAAFLLGTAGQIVKLCADAAVQCEAGDAVRGRVFALYDAVFNVCYVVAVAAAALLSPPDGWAPWLLVAAFGVYLAGLAAHDWQLRRLRVGGRPGTRAAQAPPNVT
ncbi:MFS transporter [Pseudonocardia asaccharolytica DSM 44247 = NBRC 16224]|uniref:MFS transporter n=1 Tax=Pseudonocardia asaccharolytica DSM 44247 = NBRC 16224 TaxID=1123024 RepID=A0A511D713_9PSEU|nr:MFS transporter [Pseudonocardia asaccharolytica DSM 44247 = NBRC 16224]